jgi:hypothetical protein
MRENDADKAVLEGQGVRCIGCIGMPHVIGCIKEEVLHNSERRQITWVIALLFIVCGHLSGILFIFIICLQVFVLCHSGFRAETVMDSITSVTGL